jgi:site-specific DNA recombinase
MRRPRDADGTTTPRRRCATYTRTSSDEGLDSEFNSLDAQREAGEAYITSQRQEGWAVLPGRYDDGGYSGATLDRPALQRLLADIEAGKIDIVVVYKVDRLTRSLLDFAKLVEVLDRHNVCFCSVTQPINTATPTGRLMLNVLLSFAQFEREIDGERIRDKIAATKRRGKYCGGVPVLGYDVDRQRKRLIVNRKEAALVLHAFEEFVRTGMATPTVQLLNDEGYTTKAWTTKKGVKRGGGRWNKGHLYRLLNNPLYIGEVSHKGKRYPGEHEAIIDRDLWDRAHAILEENYRARGVQTRTKTEALLRGIIRCAVCGCAMVPTFTKRRGKVYRYYLCLHASKNGHATCPVRSLPGGEIERTVIDQVRAVLRAPEFLAQTHREARAQAEERLAELAQSTAAAEAALRSLREEVAQAALGGDGHPEPVSTQLADLQTQIQTQEQALSEAGEEMRCLREDSFSERDVVDALGALDPIWEHLFPDEQARIVQLLVKQVDVYPDRAEVRIRAEGLTSLVAELREEREVVAA